MGTKTSSISSARVVATEDAALLLPPFNDDAADADAAVAVPPSP